MTFEYRRHPFCRRPEVDVETTQHDLPHMIDVMGLNWHFDFDQEATNVVLKDMRQWCLDTLGPVSDQIEDGKNWCCHDEAFHFRTKDQAMLFKLTHAVGHERQD